MQVNGCSTQGGLTVAYRVVGRQPDWLVGGKVSQVDPIPGGDQHILTFDIAMTYSSLMTLSQSMQQLESNPMLHHSSSNQSIL